MPDQEEIDRINMTKNRREVGKWKPTTRNPRHPLEGYTQMQNRMMRMQARQRATFPNLWHDPPTYLYPGQPHPTAAPPHVLLRSIDDADKNKNEKAGRGVGTVKRKRKPHNRRTKRSHTRKRRRMHAKKRGSRRSRRS